jgi:hypothetical protein
MGDQPGTAVTDRPEGPRAPYVAWLVVCLLWPAIALGGGFVLMLASMGPQQTLPDMALGFLATAVLAVAGVPVASLCFVGARRRLPRWLLAIAVAENVAVAAWWAWAVAEVGFNANKP